MSDLASTAPTLADRNYSLGRLLTAPFGAAWKGLVARAVAGPRLEQVRKLNALSDVYLAARGTTRADEVRRIFGGSF